MNFPVVFIAANKVGLCMMNNEQHLHEVFMGQGDTFSEIGQVILATIF